MQGANDGAGQSVHVVFQDEISDASLDAIRGDFFAKRPCKKNEGRLLRGKLKHVESVETGAVGEAVIGDDGVEFSGGEKPFELADGDGVDGMNVQLRAPQTCDAEIEIVATILEDQKA